MAPTPSESSDLAQQLKELQSRIDAVERRLDAGGRGLWTSGESTESEETGASESVAYWGRSSGATVLVGKSLLGLAAAYALRAATESHSIPVSVGVGLGMLYAMAWLVWAARTAAQETLTVCLRALTAVLILMPLLWEAQLRFAATTSWTSVGILTMFGIFGLAISWRKNLTAVAWITSLGVIGMASVLLVKSQEMLPFTVGLLTVAVAVEVSACLEHYVGERWVVAVVADLSVLYLTLAVPAQGVAAASGVEILAAQSALVLIYLTSALVRTLGRGFAITNFEIAQSTLAIMLAATGGLRITHWSTPAMLMIGGLCTAGGAAAYGAAHALLARPTGRSRNFHAYATFGLVLVVCGTRLSLGEAYVIPVWSLVALTMLVLGRRVNAGAQGVTFTLHATAYVLLTALGSGVLAMASSRFLGSGHAAGRAGVNGWIAIMVTLLGVWLVLPRPGVVLTRISQANLVVLLASAVWAGAGGLATFLDPACAREGPDFCPTLLTGLLAFVSLGAATLSRRLARVELGWLAWGLGAITTYKILFQDLHQAQTLGIVISLLLYGGNLIVLPKILGHTEEPSTLNGPVSGRA